MTIKLSIVTPMYGGACMANYCTAMVDLARTLSVSGIAFDFFTLSNESLVQRARNVLIHRALADPQATHVLMVDADIGFQSKDVLGMLETGAHIVCGAYSRKQIEWEQVRLAALAGAKDLAHYASSIFVQGEHGVIDVRQQRRQRLVEIRRAGTGFMLVRREVFLLLKQSGKVRSYRNRLPILCDELAEKDDRITAFFDCPIEPSTDDLLSEDFFFCDSWRSIGGKIFLAPWVELTHFGNYTFC